MSLKFLGPALLLAAAGLYVYWKQAEAPSAGNANPTPAATTNIIKPDLTPAIESMERRLANLEERVHTLEAFEPGRSAAGSGGDSSALEARIAALEVQSRRGDGPRDYAKTSRTPRRTGTNIASGGPDPYLEQLQQDFANDDQAETALQTELENAAPLFEAEEVSSLTFRQIDCRANYCRLEYEDNSSNGADAMIAENELFLLLGEKYGHDMVIHGGERSGSSRSLYIELDPGQ